MSVVAFQGESGANSETAIGEIFPAAVPLPCATFEDVFAAVTEGVAPLAVIPIENSLAGRVADIYHLLPNSGLAIIGEQGPGLGKQQPELGLVPCRADMPHDPPAPLDGLGDLHGRGPRGRAHRPHPRHAPTLPPRISALTAH